MTRRDLERFRLPRRLRAARPYPLASFTKAETGAVTIFAIISFSMLLVAIGLIVDVGRVMNVHSQANSYADRAALAAAAELDGRPGALERARKAVFTATAQIDRGFRFTLSSDRFVDVEKLTFMSSLAQDPPNPFTRSPAPGDAVVGFGDTNGVSCVRATPACDERDNREARYVLVDVTPETENYLFFPIVAFLVPDIQQSATVRPQAVAEFERQVCNTAPIMVCNIAEATGSGASFNPDPRQMIRARPQSGIFDWAPGVYSIIDKQNITNRATLRNYMARIDPNTSCSGSQIVSRDDFFTDSRRDDVRNGLNTRFDMFNTDMFGSVDNAQYTPARSVTKGLDTDRRSNRCTHDDYDTIPFPRDSCLMPGGPSSGCVSYGGIRRAGNGSWDRDDYWDENHSGQPRPAGYDTMSRYQVYRWEIDNNRVVNEPGRCSNNNGTTNANRDRRVIPVAIVNCLQHRTALRNNDEVPVEAYAEVFVTEPAGDGGWDDDDGDDNAADLYLEVIGTVRPTLPENLVRDFPVLAR